jgi:hypothetical protein
MIRILIAMAVGGFIVFVLTNPAIMAQYPLLLVAALVVAGLGGWLLRRRVTG